MTVGLRYARLISNITQACLVIRAACVVLSRTRFGEVENFVKSESAVFDMLVAVRLSRSLVRFYVGFVDC